ncbi:hypothetical protein PAXRUDRAFT_482519 [Paxillus rubicundulus Ve08.2h10]|uniref:Uncharacterized protein n=1 Tax=Paxillus rubicundulus Ve08.2h10 TaxID=930991 RepID=A0A0D0DW43_9AGAM|nr:hypothetical protein PAXRUDRAFT_482519 [Paxillus rubicundulus Ve08.2h10]
MIACQSTCPLSLAAGAELCDLQLIVPLPWDPMERWSQLMTDHMYSLRLFLSSTRMGPAVEGGMYIKDFMPNTGISSPWNMALGNHRRFASSPSSPGALIDQGACDGALRDCFFLLTF